MTRKFIYIALLITAIAGAMTVDTARPSTPLQQSAPSSRPTTGTLRPIAPPPVYARQGQKLLPGDVNDDGVLDIMDINMICNIVLQRDVPIDSAHLACADLVADGVLDVADVNALIMRVLRGEGLPPADTTVAPVDTIPPEDWMTVPPARVIEHMIVNNARSRVDFPNGRMLVWDVTPGDSLRLTVDHDNSISVWMRSYVFYPSTDSTTWTQANALAYGDGIKDITGRKSFEFTVPESAAVMVCSGYWYENGRIGDGATASLNPFTAYQLERWADTTGMVPRRQLRVLAVGNAFACDELSYVPYVVQSIAPDIDLHLRILQRPSSGIQEWAENPDSLKLGEYANTFYDWQPFPGRWSLPEAGTLRQQVEADQWDVITFQQSSSQPYWDTVEVPLRAITTWLRDSMNYRGRIGWVLNHAYSDSNVVHSTAFAELTTGDEMWQLTQALADSVMHSGMVDLLIPSGTAVQNARRTPLDNFTLNHLCAGRWDNGETGVINLQEGIGPFVAACAAAGALIGQSPLEARVNLSSTWRIPDADPHYSPPSANPSLATIDNYLGGLGMDSKSQELGAWCADQALQHPFELVDSMNTDNPTAVPLMGVQFDGQDLLIASNNGQGTEMCYKFRKCMNNQLFTFANVGFRPAARNTSSTSGIASGSNITWLNSTSSDNIGPFCVNGYADFVGGNHLWRTTDSLGNIGPYTQILTATCDSIAIHLDGEEVSAGTSGFGSCVTVDVWNTLMDPRVAPDSGATALSSPLIAEHALYTIQKNSITVEMEHRYYKDVTIDRYYGMQSMFRNEDYILTPNGAHLTWTPAENASSFKKLQYPGFDRFLEYNSANGWIQSTHLLPDGLGNHESIGDYSFIFVRGGTKDYHVLMDKHSVHSGDTTAWKGIYSWAPLLVDGDILLAYESVMDGHDVIYIDAKSTGRDTLSLPAGWTGFRVISSDEGITLTPDGENGIIVDATTAASAIIERTQDEGLRRRVTKV